MVETQAARSDGQPAGRGRRGRGCARVHDRRPHVGPRSEHGAPAPGHSRRDAHPRARGRRALHRGAAAPGLPPSLRREDRGERGVVDVPAVHRPLRLPGGDEQQPGLLDGGREAHGHRDPAARADDPDDLRRAQPHRLALDRLRDLRARPGRDHPVPLHVPRAGMDDGAVREDLRRAPHLQLHPHRRRVQRRAPRLAERGRALLRHLRGEVAGVRQPPDGEPDLRQADGERRGHPARDGAGLRPDRPDAAR